MNMVRPVEPDPPRPIPRAQGGVRGTTATPEQLGHTPVQERQDRPGRKKTRTAERSEGDQVLIHGTENAAETVEPQAHDEEEQTRAPKPQEHIDLQG